MKVADKTILVTGGGNGLGRELVLNLLRKGSKVVAVDIDKTALIGTKQLAGIDAKLLMLAKADITNEKMIEDITGTIIDRFGSIDGVINNAGIIQPFRKVNDIDSETIDRVFKVNFMGTLNVIKIFLPYLLRRPEAHIVNVSSMGGFLPVAGQSIYGASKAAVKVLSEALTSELSDTNVGVTTVFPGAMYTNIKANSGLGVDVGAGTEGHSENVALSPTKAAEMMVNAIECNKSRLFIGRDAKSMNFLYRISPEMAINMIYKKISHNM